MPTPRHVLIVGGTADDRRRRADAATAELGPGSIVALDAATLPFLRPKPTLLPASVPRVLRIDAIELAFLRGSGFAAAVLVGAVAVPGVARAQNPQRTPEQQDQTPKDGAPPADNSEDASKGKPEEDPFKVTKIDGDGKPYRMCPQCGYKMYKQDRTWTCENCGYSYDE